MKDAIWRALPFIHDIISRDNFNRSLDFIFLDCFHFILSGILTILAFRFKNYILIPFKTYVITPIFNFLYYLGSKLIKSFVNLIDYFFKEAKRLENSNNIYVI